jgi:hypothetical protein
MSELCMEGNFVDIFCFCDLKRRNLAAFHIGLILDFFLVFCSVHGRAGSIISHISVGAFLLLLAARERLMKCIAWNERSKGLVDSSDVCSM